MCLGWIGLIEISALGSEGKRVSLCLGIGGMSNEVDWAEGLGWVLEIC